MKGQKTESWVFCICFIELSLFMSYGNLERRLGAICNAPRRAAILLGAR